MIELIPAIDIINGQCVRLVNGNYSQKTVYHNDPIILAKELENAGFKRLHIVDLDGAKSSHVVNDNILKNITSSTNMTVDFGGGVKTEEDFKKVIDSGASMVTIGSIAALQPEIFCDWLDKYGTDRIILGADVSNGKIAVNGWKENSHADLFEFLSIYIGKGVKNVLCTDISRDGTMKGPSFELYSRIMHMYPNLHLIASGGISSNEDILQLERLGIPAVVFGKAYYEGKIDGKKLISYDV